MRADRDSKTAYKKQRREVNAGHSSKCETEQREMVAGGSDVMRPRKQQTGSQDGQDARPTRGETDSPKREEHNRQQAQAEEHFFIDASTNESNELGTLRITDSDVRRELRIDAEAVKGQILHLADQSQQESKDQTFRTHSHKRIQRHFPGMSPRHMPGQQSNDDQAR